MPKPEQKTGLGLFLKVLANSASYGIFAEMNRHELSGRRKENLAIFGLSSFETPEEGGPATAQGGLIFIACAGESLGSVSINSVPAPTISLSSRRVRGEP